MNRGRPLNLRSVSAGTLLLLLPSFSLTCFAQDDQSIILAPSSAPTAAIATPAVPKKETTGKQDQELLRDPFWPIGFFPPNWQRKADLRGQSGADDAGGWVAAAAKLRVSGTSQLGDRTAAIISGELKSIGEQVEVLYEGKMYQWEIIGIGANGQIQLKKMGIR